MRTEVKVFLAESYDCLPADVRAVGGKICRTFGVCLLSLGGCFDKSDKTTVESGNPEDADALFNLGVLYENGRGVPQDDAEAVKWYRKAAEQGYAEAQYSLGFNYAQGKGVPENAVEGYAWFAVAATTGRSDAVRERDRSKKQLSQSQLAKGQQRATELFNKYGSGK